MWERDINGNWIWIDNNGKRTQVTNEGTISSNAGTKKQAVARQSATQRQKEQKKAQERENRNSRNEIGRITVTGTHQDPITKEVITDEGYDPTAVNVIGMSGRDPLLGTITDFYIGDKILRGVGNLALEGLGRYGSNLGWKKGQTWARNKILADEFRKSPILNYNESPMMLYPNIKGEEKIFFNGKLIPMQDYYQQKFQQVMEEKFPKNLILENNVEILPFSNLHTIVDAGNFIPRVKAKIGKFNELYGQETTNRLKDLGYDVETPIPILEQGFRNLRKPISAIEANSKKPVYLGTFKEGYGRAGEYWSDLDEALADPVLSRNLPSVMFHERNMHGTDNIIEGFSSIGQPKAKNMYQDFLDKLFVRRINYGDVDVLEPAPGIERIGDDYIIDYGNGIKNPMSIGTNQWYEGRSTINELKRKYLYNVWSKNGKPEILETVRPQYLQKIDELSEKELLSDLANETNGYGQAYVALRKNNPQFIPELKHLLKYGPAFTGAAYITNKKQGGKLNNKFKYYVKT